MQIIKKRNTKFAFKTNSQLYQVRATLNITKKKKSIMYETTF